MPAMLDDPDSPTIYRTSGDPPFPSPNDPAPVDIVPRQVTLRDRVTVATVVPFFSFHQVPPTLLVHLSDQLNREIEGGDTYPMEQTMPLDKFSAYWFQNFGAVVLLGAIASPAEVLEGRDWAHECLGSFYIKPNYPGRSSHVCNAGFLVTNAARNRGVGRLMGEAYLEWALQLGYTYSVFNLVYETNLASCRIWDALGFKRIGLVPGCGALRSHPDRLVDAIIYGRALGAEGDDFVREDRFDKIKFYLRHGRYPSGAARAEKSRLRSAATHYKLLDDDRLMLRDREVVSEPQRQYEIAAAVHAEGHVGINKTTATIADKYHWIRIKETVSLVIRNCPKCKAAAAASAAATAASAAATATATAPTTITPAAAAPPASGSTDDVAPAVGQTQHAGPSDAAEAVSTAGRALALSSSSSSSSQQQQQQQHHPHPHSEANPAYGEHGAMHDYYMPLESSLPESEFSGHGDLDMLIE